MKFHVMTLFPSLIESVLGESIIGRAAKDGLISVSAYNIRDYSLDKHRKTDDTPFGGGMGMVMTCQPIFDCYGAVLKNVSEGAKKKVIYMSPKGRLFTHSVARLEKVKGQDLLLNCAKDVLKKYPEVHFVFLGDGSMRQEYLCRVYSLGIEKDVTFLGYVSDPSVYQRDFFVNVNTSRGTETSCLATSECMSLGIPTVASDFGGNPEMITDGENGLIFDRDDPFSLSEKLCEILGDSALYKKLSLGAKESYRTQFSLDRMAEEYKRLYLSLYSFIKKIDNPRSLVLKY